ncbi:MAG TPA: hydrogenase 3 maturation endopeptidase HyCI [Candidatus Bathyarchaeia archaeon]
MSNVVEKDLKNWFADAKKIVVAGIGNPIRSDDYVGLKIVENLRGKVPETVCLLECETVPENYLSEIEKFKPTHVLLVDAAFLELKPGEASLVDAERMMDYSAISTHALPLKIFCEHLKKTTDAKIGLLLIEPKNMEFGEGLSVEVEAAAERLTKLFLELLVQRPLFFSKRSWS